MATVKVMPRHVFTELPETYTLSEEQTKFYDDNGYFVIKQLIDFTTLYSCKQRFTQICKGIVDKGYITFVKEHSLVKEGVKREDYVNKIQDILFDDVLSTYTENPRLLHVVSQLIGDNITGVHSMFINKPPGTGPHPPHQDLYYFPFRPAHKIIAAWTAIDHAHTDNGCLYVVPGSHKQNTLYAHGDIQDKKRFYHGIANEDSVAPLAKRVHLEMSPGDTVFFHPLLVHGSGPNVTKNFRKAISCHYANSECHYIDVSGTLQENIANEILTELRRRGLHEFSFTDAFRFRSKLVKGVKCNL